MRPPRGPSNSAADRGRPVVKRPLVPRVRLVLLAVVRMVNGLPATWLVGALGEVAQAISRIARHGSVRVAKGGTREAPYAHGNPRDRGAQHGRRVRRRENRGQT